jgi:hypothetical protein
MKTFDGWTHPDNAADAELRVQAERLAELGARPVYELLREALGGADLRARLQKYAELDVGIVKYLGANGDRRRPGGKP